MLNKLKKGFGMVFFILATFVIIFTCLIGFVFFRFSLDMVDGSSSPGEATLENYPEFFSVEKVRFYDDTLVKQLEQIENGSQTEVIGACNSIEKLIIIDLLFNLTKVPNACQISVDNELDKIFPVDVDYSTNMTEIIIPIPLTKYSSADNHIIETCCDDICTKTVLESICTFDN